MISTTFLHTPKDLVKPLFSDMHKVVSDMHKASPYKNEWWCANYSICSAHGPSPSRFHTYKVNFFPFFLRLPSQPFSQATAVHVPFSHPKRFFISSCEKLTFLLKWSLRSKSHKILKKILHFWR